MSVSRYGKPAQDVLAHKRDMFGENARYLEDSDRQAERYLAQPLRSVCKICGAPRADDDSFRKGRLAVTYSLCSTCGHLNGAHEDSDDYAESLYLADSGAEYGANYFATDATAFARRVADIYLPKAEFLSSVAPDIFEDGTFLDVGCGSGYFAAALAELGVKDVVGIDVSASQIQLATDMVPTAAFSVVGVAQIPEVIRETAPRFVSMVGVLEHLQDPVAVLAAIRDTPSVERCFLSVPLYSPSVLFELAMPQVFPRQLSGGHTHLFTEASLDHVATELLGFTETGSWWFGTDMVDLYRSLSVLIGPDSPFAQEELRRMLLPVLDDLQLVLDRQHLSSEVHRVLSRPTT